MQVSLHREGSLRILENLSRRFLTILENLWRGFYWIRYLTISKKITKNNVYIQFSKHFLQRISMHYTMYYPHILSNTLSIIVRETGSTEVATTWQLYAPLSRTSTLLIIKVWFKCAGENVTPLWSNIRIPLNPQVMEMLYGVGMQSIRIGWLSKVLMLSAVACSKGTVRNIHVHNKKFLWTIQLHCSYIADIAKNAIGYITHELK